MAMSNIPPESPGSMLLDRDACCCSVCLKPYVDPRMLLCGHTFCLQCIDSWWISEGKGREIRCPECRGKTPLVNKDIKALQKNFQVTALLEMLKNASYKSMVRDPETLVPKVKPANIQIPYDKQKPELLWVRDYRIDYSHGVAFTSEGNIVISDTKNSCLVVIDFDTGQSLRTIGDGQLNPVDVTVSGDFIYATDKKNNCVQVYTDTGVHKQSWGKGKYSSPLGITPLRNGNIAVTDISNGTSTIHDNRTGRITTCFGQTGNDKTCLKQPTYIAEDSKGRIIITDQDSKTIKIYDPVGNMLQEITEKEAGKKISFPKGVCVDANDNILLALYDDRSVVKFDSSGRYIGTVLTRDNGVRDIEPIALHPGGGYLAFMENNFDGFHDFISVLKLFKIP